MTASPISSTVPLTFLAKPISCVTTIMVMPSFASLRISSSILEWSRPVLRSGHCLTVWYHRFSAAPFTVDELEASCYFELPKNQRYICQLSPVLRGYLFDGSHDTSKVHGAPIGGWYHKVVFKRSKASHLLNLLKVVPHHVVVLRSSHIWVAEEIITYNQQQYKFVRLFKSSHPILLPTNCLHL